MENLKTITLTGQYDEPLYSILPGHHSIETFNQAFFEEGWNLEPWPDDYVSHEFWIDEGDGIWSCSNKLDPRSQPVTVACWEGSPENIPAKGPNPGWH